VLLSKNVVRKLFLIESSPRFNRFDIVNKLVEFSKYMKENKSIYIIILYKKPNMYVIDRARYTIHDVVNPLEYLIGMLKACKMTTLLTEKGTYNTQILEKSDCFIAGLHSDIPEDIVTRIGSELCLNKVKLSNVPYHAVVVASVIDIYFENPTEDAESAFRCSLNG